MKLLSISSSESVCVSSIVLLVSLCLPIGEKIGEPSWSGGEKLVALPHIFRTGDELIAVLRRKGGIINSDTVLPYLGVLITLPGVTIDPKFSGEGHGESEELEEMRSSSSSSSSTLASPLNSFRRRVELDKLLTFEASSIERFLLIPSGSLKVQNRCRSASNSAGGLGGMVSCV